MPASSNRKLDRDIFLKLLTLDDDGTWMRRKAVIPARLLLAAAPKYSEEWRNADAEEREALEATILNELDDKQRRWLDDRRKFPLSRAQFDALPYGERIRHTVRPEQIAGPTPEAWEDVNRHLQTNAYNLQDLTEQLGNRLFGRSVRIGDCFCGGGSVPFEAARLGANAFSSDLNPAAALLTWGAINLVGSKPQTREIVSKNLETIFNRVLRQVTDWGIEQSEEGWQAEAYLRCVQVKPLGAQYPIPLARTWIIAQKRKVCAVLSYNKGDDNIDINIIENAEENQWYNASTGESATIPGERIIDPFDKERSWSIEGLRGPNGLPPWESQKIASTENDIFQERLYCIRWRSLNGDCVFRAPTAFDLANEQYVTTLLNERLEKWVNKGYIPFSLINKGEKTDELIRTRGWTHWHHLYGPRQLLLIGLLYEQIEEFTHDKNTMAAIMLGIGSVANRNSKLCGWIYQLGSNGGFAQTFYNQALNTLYNWGERPILALRELFMLPSANYPLSGAATVRTLDARDVNEVCDLWITDPPYADAVNYHELADYFLSWYGGAIKEVFPSWHSESRLKLAVKGSGEEFLKAIVEIYSNLCRHTSANGLQVVMFTHKNPAVWAVLGMVLWAAELRVSAAWTIATETPANGLRKGDYVSGTVLLVLRKRIGGEDGFLDEVYPQVADEVRRQIDSMRELDDDSDPNFGDTDYQLAAYAAALRVLTGYATIDGEDVRKELFRPEVPKGRGKNAAQSKSRFEKVIDRAIEIACDYLIPRGLEDQWATLTADERLYLRAVDVESRGERRSGVYQELARGFGVRDVKVMQQSGRANSVRVKTATEFARRDLGGLAFAGTPLRRLLFAIHETARTSNPDIGRRYLFDEMGGDYWSRRTHMVALLEWLAQLGQQSGMAHWHGDAEAARLLAGRLFNDHG